MVSFLCFAYIWLALTPASMLIAAPLVSSTSISLRIPSRSSMARGIRSSLGVPGASIST